MTTFAALAAMLVAAAPVGAQDDPATDCVGSPSDCSYLRAATEEFTAMLVTGDPAPLRRHLDARAVWVTSGGEVRSGAQLIETVKTDTRRYTATLEFARVRVSGDVAVVSWRESWTIRTAALKFGKLSGVDTWVKRGRDWKVVSTVEMVLPR